MERSFDATVFTKNQQRLLDHDASRTLFDEVVWSADEEGLLSDEHFSVDGNLIEVPPTQELPAQGGSTATLRRFGQLVGGLPGEHRSNATHASTTDPEARLLRKGGGKEAKLAFLGHALTGTATACGWTSWAAWPPARPSGVTTRARWGPTAATTPRTVSRTSGRSG